MTAEDLYRIAFLEEPQLSPDGTKVAYVVKSIDESRQYRSHLFVQGIEQDAPVQWTYGSVLDTAPRWSPDGRSLAFVSNRSGQPQIWLFSAEGGEPRQLTTCRHGARQPVWSPDGTRILFSTRLSVDERADEEAPPSTDREASASAGDDRRVKRPMVIDRLKYKSDESGFFDGKYRHLAVLDLITGEVRQITEGPYDHDGGAWSPDGTMIAFTANRTDDPDRALIADVYVVSIRTDEWRRLTNGTGVFSVPSWSPDGSRIACIGHEKEYAGATLKRIWTIDLVSGGMTCVTRDWDVHVGDVAIGDMRSDHADRPVLWTPDGSGVYFLASDRGSTGVYHAGLDGSVSPVAGGERHVYAVTMDRERKTAVLAASDPLNPGDLYRLSLTTGVERRLTRINQALLDEVVLSRPEPLAFEAEDGWQIHGWIMKPVGWREGETYPLILEIHGGPHMMYGYTFFHEMQMLASRGYAVLFTNPRGSHGYGQRFVDACRGDYGGKDYRDLMNAVDYAVKTFAFIDESRMGVTGGSYGGFMTNWIVGQTNRFRAAVTQRSISNWLSFYGVSDIGYFFAADEIGANLYDNPDKLWQHSPLRHAAQVETPLLILHGERDYRCPIEQAEQFYAALKHQGKAPVRLVRFPDANHELSRSGDPVLRVERLRLIADWFDQYVKAGAEERRNEYAKG